MEDGQQHVALAESPEEQLRESDTQQQQQLRKTSVISETAKMTGMTALLLTGVVVFLVTREQAPPFQNPYSEMAAEAEGVVTEWLEAQRRGEDGYDYWHDRDCCFGRWDIHPSRMFSVKSWEIVDVDSNLMSADVCAIIDSSLQIGTPITKTWRIEVNEYDDELKITAIKDLSE